MSAIPRGDDLTHAGRIKRLEEMVAELSRRDTVIADAAGVPRDVILLADVTVPAVQSDVGTINTVTIPAIKTDAATTKTTADTALAKTTDGLPPASSPAAEVTGGLGVLFIRWPAVANANPVTYNVYVDTTTGFTPGAGNLVAQTGGTSITVRTLTAGTALAYGTTYYAKIVASDADGSAVSGAGAEGSGSMLQVNSPDIAANAISATQIAADAITGKTVTGGLFRTMTTGKRLEIDSATANQIKFFSGAAGEVAAGTIDAGETSPGSGDGVLHVASPVITAGGAFGQLTLTSNATGTSAAAIGARNVQTSATNLNQMQAGLHTLEVNSSGGFTFDTVPVVTTTDTQTLTNKTLTSPTITGSGAISAGSLNLGLGSTVNDVQFGSGSFTVVAGGLGRINVPHSLGVVPTVAFVTFQNSQQIGTADLGLSTTTSVVVNVRNITAAGALVADASVVVCRFLFIV